MIWGRRKKVGFEDEESLLLFQLLKTKRVTLMTIVVSYTFDPFRQSVASFPLSSYCPRVVCGPVLVCGVLVFVEYLKEAKVLPGTSCGLVYLLSLNMF